MARGRVIGVLGFALVGCLHACGSPTPDIQEPPPVEPPDQEAVLEPPLDKGGRCQPTAGGPYWLEEGETLTLTVSCATGRRGPPEALRIEPLPTGAQYDRKTATLRWTPGLDQAGVYELNLRAPGNESGTVKVGVADHWKHPDNVPVVDPIRYTEEYGLPVFHLQGASRLHPDGHEPLTLIYRGHTYAAEGKKRGTSSLGFPKNNYTLKFPADDPFNEPLLGDGFTARRSLVLLGNFNDNSYLRARLGFELWRQLSPQSVQVRTFSAVVFLDGHYHGLYTVVDHVNKRLMGAHGLNPDGNLYQARTGGANFRLEDQFGQPKPYLHVGYLKKDGTPEDGEPGAYDDLDAFVHFVATATDDAFRTEGPQRFELRDYENWWAFVTLLVAIDSDVKNSYHYHDPAGGPWRYVPWDLDGSFGQTWRTQRLRPTAPLDVGQDNELFRRILAEPTFAEPLKARLRSALSQELAPALLQARLDALAQEVAPSARRDEARWAQLYRDHPDWPSRTDFTTFDEEVAYVRQWIALRWAFLDTQLAPEP